VSVLVEAAQLVLLITMSSLTTVSGVVLTRSIEGDDAVTAWMWAAAFVATSLLTDLLFWSVV
jgi:hypothetical protein